MTASNAFNEDKAVMEAAWTNGDFSLVTLVSRIVEHIEIYLLQQIK